MNVWVEILFRVAEASRCLFFRKDFHLGLMSNTSKTAIGALMTALSVVILFPTALEIFVYALPLFAGIITAIAVAEMGKNWAAAIYFATSIISLIVVPNKEAVIMYVAFFGYYGIIKSILESNFPKVPEYILKFLIFNASVIIASIVTMKVLGLTFYEYMEIDGTKPWVKFAVPLMLGTANIGFLLFDFLISRVVTIYMLKWRKRIHKMFRFK